MIPNPILHAASVLAESIEPSATDRGEDLAISHRENRLTATILAFEAASRAKSLWHEHVYHKNIRPYDPAEERSIVEVHRTLVAKAEPLIRELASLELAGQAVDGADRLRAFDQAARRVLEEDAELAEALKIAPSREQLRALIERHEANPSTINYDDEIEMPL